ncbi:MAG TPA: hypothetical protein VMU50_15370 [Polyangia bacterium]|nr:hypothetical protein [Polyangia bacterium]
MTKKIRMTKQGVRDLNHHGPRPPKIEPVDRVYDEPKQSSVGTSATGETSTTTEPG